MHLVLSAVYCSGWSGSKHCWQEKSADTLPWDTIKVQALGLSSYVVVDFPSVGNCPHAQFMVFQYVQQFPGKPSCGWCVTDVAPVPCAGCPSLTRAISQTWARRDTAQGAMVLMPVSGHRCDTGWDSALSVGLWEGAEQAQSCQSQGTSSNVGWASNWVVSAVIIPWQPGFGFSNGCPGIQYHGIIKQNSLNSWLFLTASCSQFPPQTAASPDELKVYALWEAGDTYDQVKIKWRSPLYFCWAFGIVCIRVSGTGTADSFPLSLLVFLTPTCFQLKGSP